MSQSSGLTKVEDSLLQKFRKLAQDYCGTLLSIGMDVISRVTSFFKMAAKAPITFQPTARERGEKDMGTFFKDSS